MPCVQCGRWVSKHGVDVVNDGSQSKFQETKGVNGGAVCIHVNGGV